MKINFKSSCISILLIILSSSVANADTKENNFNKTNKFYQYILADNKPKIALLRLFFTKMPKGGDLHNHYTGTIYAETYLEWVKRRGWLIDSCTFNIVREKNNNHCKVLTVTELLADSNKLSKLLTLWSSKDFYNHSHNTLAPDVSFFNTFNYFFPVNKAYRKNGLNIIKKRAIKENVAYIEIMLSHPSIDVNDYFTKDDIAKYNNLLLNAKTQKSVDKILYDIGISLIGHINFNKKIDNFLVKVKTDHANIDDNNFIIRYQSYAIRTTEPLRVFIDLLAGYLTTVKSPLIVGVNIVGPESNYIALRDYTLHMMMYNYLARQYPSVNKALHAGELTLGMVRPKDLTFHIKEALDIAGARRIGHGVDIVYEDNSIALLNNLKKRAVIEINLTSNEFILGVKDYEHPYIIYSKYNVPLVISTDDSGVSRNNLSNEYVLLASRYQPSYKTIKNYVYNSIKYSFLTNKYKKILKNRLDKSFALFEMQIAGFYDKN